MEFKKNHIVNISLALIVASTTILLSQTTFFKRLELLSRDLLYHLRPAPKDIPQDIVIIAITDDEIKEIGRWPWERTWLTKMTEALIEFKPKQVLYDFIMTAESDPVVDAQLSTAMARSGNIYLPSYWWINKRGERESVEPIPQLIGSAKKSGFVNLVADVDGNYRKIPIYSMEDEGVQFNIILEMAADRLGGKITSYGADGITITTKESDVTIPVVEGNHMELRWYGPWGETFRKYSFLDVLKAHEDVREGRKPKIDVGSIKDSVCIVAVTATGLYDIKPVPLQPHYPGAGIVATALGNILHRDFVHSAPRWLNALFIYFVVLIPPFFILQDRPAREICNIIGGVLVFILVYLLFLNAFQLFLAAPIIALLGSYIMVTSYNFASYKALMNIIETKQKTNLMLLKKYKGLKEEMVLTEKEKEDLVKANRELDEFVQMVSHDIRAPLLGLIGYTDLLETSIKDSLDEKDKGLLNGIFNSIDRLNTLIDDMLQATRISHIKKPYEQVDIEELIRSVLNGLSFQIEQSKAHLTIATGLPSIVCDPIKMKEIFHNLISNAIKFSSIGGAVPEIEISYQERSGTHEFCVKDNGAGVDPKEQSAIFEPNTRAASNKGVEGSGMGLSLVKRAIHDHHGRVWIESAVGQGAAFYFIIPKNLTDF